MSGPTKRDRRLLRSVISSPVLGPVTRNQGKTQARPRAVALAAAVPGYILAEGYDMIENHTILDSARQTRGAHTERIGSNDAIDQETPHLRYQRGP